MRTTAGRLLRLYPPAWRARYGEEFLATAGDGPLGARNVFDVVMMAIDAWLSSDVRNATRALRPATDAGGMSMHRMLTCGRSSKVTPRDGLIGAGIMLAVSFALSGLGIWANRSGWPATAEMLKGLSFPASFTVSMPWWLMKGSPWKAQCVIIGVTLLILVLATWVATKI